jgi:hypothetical protein
MADEIQGKDSVVLGKNLDLFLPHPETGPIAVDQEQRASGSCFAVE